MKKFLFFLLAGLIVILGGIWYFSVSRTSSTEPSAGGLTEAQARTIAQSACLKAGETLSETGTFNENSQTWWFDAQLTDTPAGCNPACVVNVENENAEINWRCTGLMVPDESLSETLRQLFAEKYPDYADTLSVRVDKENSDFARGGITFVTGQPGGIFLAAKVNGQWQIVHDGNGMIPCSLSVQYGFPSDFVSDCAE